MHKKGTHYSLHTLNWKGGNFVSNFPDEWVTIKTEIKYSWFYPSSVLLLRYCCGTAAAVVLLLLRYCCCCGTAAAVLLLLLRYCYCCCGTTAAAVLLLLLYCCCCGTAAVTVLLLRYTKGGHRSTEVRVNPDNISRGGWGVILLFTFTICLWWLSPLLVNIKFLI